MLDWSWLLRTPLRRLLLQLLMTGAAAAVLAWSLAFGLYLVFDASRPTMGSLGFAILRGAVLALLLGLALRSWIGRRQV